MTYPKVSIIILNWNGLKDTIKCLESLKKITYSNYEVIVVDNGSKGNDADVLDKKYGDYIKLIRNKENLGFAEGNNIAIREIIKEGKSEYILCLNNDTKVEPNFLNELIKCSQRHPMAGSIQPKMIWGLDKRLIDSVGIKFLTSGLAFDRGKFERVEKYDREEEILGCCAGACLYRKEALQDIMINDEIFDKDFFCYYEDVDLSLRLQWVGWKSWYCPSSVVYHFWGKEGKAGSVFSVYYGMRNQIWTLYKNLPFSFIFKKIFKILFVEIVRIFINLLKGRKRKIKAIIKAEFDAYRNITRILKKRKNLKKRVNFSEIEKFFTSGWRLKVPKQIKKKIYGL